MKDAKAFEIQGFRDIIMLCLFVLISVGLLLGIPTSFVWVGWNGIVGDVAHGPYIAFWQALILTLALFVLFYLVAQPEIALEIKRVDTPDDTPKAKKDGERLIKKLKDKTDSK